MMVRDKRRIYKRVCLTFVLAVVTLTIFQRGSDIQFHLNRQAIQAAPQETSLNRRALLSGSNKFWKETEPRSKLTTEETGVTEGKESRVWDTTTTNCTANRNISKNEWFGSLGNNFKQFLLYRHCRHFPIIMNHPEKCDGDVYLLIVIKSVITQYERREVIRKTWGKEKEIGGKKVKTLFLLGVSSNEAEKANHQKLLEYEDYIYGDIIQWDFMDSFFNLTLKETHFLKWFSIYCANVQYIFKGDDDVFVGVQNIFEFLESAQVRNLFAGDVIFKARPIRRKDNKYYIPQALYNKTLYPPYAGGGGFLMDGQLARNLYGACETLDLYPIDDVFLGMCLEVLKVMPIKHNGFKTFGLVKNKSSKLNTEPCFFKSMMVVHKLLPQDLLNMWNLVNSDIVCSKKVQLP